MPTNLRAPAPAPTSGALATSASITPFANAEPSITARNAVFGSDA